MFMRRRRLTESRTSECSCRKTCSISAEAASGDTIRHVTMTNPWPVPQPIRARNWPATALAGLAVVLAATALIVALTRSGPAPRPNYTSAQKAEAKAQLCDRYRLAAQAMHIETSIPDSPALARVALTNGALILETAAANPALDAHDSSAARALATAYQTQTAISTTAPNEQFQKMGEDLNVKDSVMHGICGG